MAEIEAMYSQLNNKRLSNEQIDMFVQYIKSFGKENELKEELIYLISDYNNIISIAQKLYDCIGIKSLTNSKNNVDCDPINTINDIIDEDNMLKKQKDDLIKMKLTNSILKQIEFTRKNSHIFTTKYADGDYTDFLSKLINYNYSISTLSSISNDIKKYDSSFKAKGYSSTSPKPISKDNIEPYSFNNSLRQYNCNNITEQMAQLEKKPFDNNTQRYGNFFDKKLNSYSQII